MLQRKYMEKNRSIARTVSIEAVLQPRFHYAMNYFSFDAEVLFAFFVFGDTFFMLGLMGHIGLGSDRRRLAGFPGRFSQKNRCTKYMPFKHRHAAVSRGVFEQLYSMPFLNSAVQRSARMMHLFW